MFVVRGYTHHSHNHKHNPHLILAAKTLDEMGNYLPPHKNPLKSLSNVGSRFDPMMSEKEV